MSAQDETVVTALANRTADLMTGLGLDIHEATRRSIDEMTKTMDRWLGLWQDRDVKDAFADRMWWKINGGQVAA